MFFYCRCHRAAVQLRTVAGILLSGSASKRTLHSCLLAVQHAIRPSPDAEHNPAGVVPTPVLQHEHTLPLHTRSMIDPPDHSQSSAEIAHPVFNTRVCTAKWLICRMRLLFSRASGALKATLSHGWCLQTRPYSSWTRSSPQLDPLPRCRLYALNAVYAKFTM